MYLPATPAIRALGVGAALAGILLTFRPDSMFAEDGSAKIWSVTAPADLGKGIETTPVPWWLATVVVVIAIDLFV